MKRVLYFTVSLWLVVGSALVADIAFDLNFKNAAALLVGFLGLAVLGFVGMERLQKTCGLPKWLGVIAATISFAAILALGLIVSLVAALGPGVPFDSSPEYYPQVGGLKCQAQIFGGATVSFNRVDVSIFQPLLFGLERKVAHQSRIEEGNGGISLAEECSKLMSNQKHQVAHVYHR